MARNVRIDKEGGAQEMLFRWITYQLDEYPELALLYHIPNGGKRDAKTATILKRQGVKAGVPDLHLPVARGGYHGLYIELKVGDNTTTKKQKDWIRELNKQGYLAVVCYGWDEAAKQLLDSLETGTATETARKGERETAQDLLAPAT